MLTKDHNSARPPGNKIIIVDDHLLFADGLELILSQADDNYDVMISCEAEKVLSETNYLQTFDLLLVDLHMPKVNGFNFLQAIRAQNLQLNVVVISGTEEKADIERALRLGASGFIPKDSPTQEMLLGIRQVLSGKRYLPQQWDGKINWLEEAESVAVPATVKIGPKQLQVLKMMREGMQNRQIAAVLGVSVSGVKRHVERLFKELNVDNRTACVQAALKQKLL